MENLEDEGLKILAQINRHIFLGEKNHLGPWERCALCSIHFDPLES